MTRDGIAELFNVNRSVTRIGERVRSYQLPALNPLPKLAAATAGATVPAGQLPEMVSDLIDESAVYAVENVKRERARTPGLVERVWNTGPRESRP